MADKEVVTIRGLRQLGENMRKLAEETNKKIVNSSARAGAVIVRDQARANVDSRRLIETGLMREGVGVRKLKRDERVKDGVAIYGVGVFKVKGQLAFYWRFHEFGTIYETPKPFLQPAFQSRRLGAALKIADTAKKGIKNAVNKLPKGKTST